jgi:hypothetical protein
MKTIIDKNTGEVLFATLNEVDLKQNEIAIDNLLQDNFVSAYWSFENSTFYENATAEEIAQATVPTLTVNEVIIDLVTKQVETMTDEEKNDLLTLLNT